MVQPTKLKQAPGRGTTWRPLTKRETLPDLRPTSPDALQLLFAEFGTVLGGGMVPGARRCGAIGLIRGDCTQQHVEDSAYCYYHDKVQRGEITDHHKTNWSGAAIEEDPRNLYPVWPLPKNGYVLLTEALAA